MKKLLVLGLLVLAACSGAPTSPGGSVRPVQGGPPRGVDLAGDARDVSSELRGSGLDFVARYYRDPASRWPTLSAAEAAMLSGAGLNIVAIWESHSHKPDYFSYAAGYADAISAYRQAKAIGQPAGSAIYFAVDYNAPAADIQGPVDQYFRGIRAGLAAAGGGADYRIGAYGSGAVCDYLKRMRLAQYTWLSNSTAWHGSTSFADWNIKQSKASPAISFPHDWNEARGEYGAFQVKSQYTAL